MIKNTDVRIGNLILGVSDRIEKVVEIGENYCYTQISTMPSHTQEWVDVNGIALTEDWLLKLGFEWDSITYYKTRLMLSKRKSGGYAVFYGTLTHGQIDECTIYYVHQLQNLVNALTGQELQLTT